ncbi:TetR/AcrR family transcriptional regulator [Nocardia amamiensis]|uniref:TetR/AcrR family transcriptional regulator n=1 Tax=Nocardia amamiensis TaxID=404578 RepID=UPI00082E4BDF|nr:TetR family transcriptional regulator [Nocardia amamiensis]
MTEADGSIPGMRRWRGRSPADRVAARREQLIEACTELMATIGAAETSMRGVCRQAGLTERYFYESYPNLDALLTIVLDTVVLGARDRLLAELPNAPTERDAMFRHLVGVFTDYLVADRRRGRIMFVESQATPVLMPRANELILLFTAPIALIIGGGDYADPVSDEHDFALNANAIFGALAYLYRPWLDGEIPVSRERFDEHAANVIERIATARSSLGTGA